jgi:hypothetical protein
MKFRAQRFYFGSFWFTYSAGSYFPEPEGGP